MLTFSQLNHKYDLFPGDDHHKLGVFVVLVFMLLWLPVGAYFESRRELLPSGRLQSIVVATAPIWGFALLFLAAWLFWRLCGVVGSITLWIL